MSPDQSGPPSNDAIDELVRAAAMRYEAALFGLVPGGEIPDPANFVDSVPVEARAKLSHLLGRMASVYASQRSSGGDSGSKSQAGTLLAYVSGDSLDMGRTIVVADDRASDQPSDSWQSASSGDSQFD